MSLSSVGYLWPWLSMTKSWALESHIQHHVRDWGSYTYVCSKTHRVDTNTWIHICMYIHMCVASTNNKRVHEFATEIWGMHESVIEEENEEGNGIIIL